MLAGLADLELLAEAGVVLGGEIAASGELAKSLGDVSLNAKVAVKAFGGAYIVMGSKKLGADLNLAWPRACAGWRVGRG